ncbi:MAG: alpha-galactosidase [Gemmatimonadota bacterium]
MSDVSSTTHPEDMARNRAVAGRLLGSAAALPVTFRLGDRAVAGIPHAWQPLARTRRIDARLVETTWEGRDPVTGLALRVEILEYGDYPVVEWTAWLTNEGAEPTPILSDLLALDGVLEGASPVLWHSNGDFYSQDGYGFEETPVQAGTSLDFAPAGGRPCDRAFPYFRLAFAGGGHSIAIGWPGQWSASFAAVSGGVRVRAGQERTHLRLRPGETVRTPRLAVMSWTGDARRAANLWRRWHRDHLLPRPDGQRLGPRLVGHGTDEGEEFTAATEENQQRYIEKWAAQGIPINTWWIDAGWYPCYGQDGQRHWWETGTWEPDPERFPRGLGPVSAAAARHGADLLVWFEPERVRPGSRLDREHPEWLLPAAGTDNRLLDLGNPACRQWLTDHVCRVIRQNGIRIYRQDFNFEPLAHWRENDAEDRQGMNENLHVQGYLQYWDDLLARNPGLWIDSCSSGGRRNDLETMRRSVPLHYTDFGYGNHPVKLAFHHVLFEWLPYFKEVTLSWDLAGPARFDHQVDSYSYHCGLGPMLTPGIDIRRDDYDYPLVRQMVEIWRRAADLILGGDYYPLTPMHRSTDQWVARQFDCPETGRGFVQGIRLPDCPDGALVVHPRGILPEGVYLLENPETGHTLEKTGQSLIEAGYTLEAPRRGGVIWFYRRRG